MRNTCRASVFFVLCMQDSVLYRALRPNQWGRGGGHLNTVDGADELRDDVRDLEDQRDVEAHARRPVRAGLRASK